MMHRTARPGFTLLELIVYVGITALVVVSLTNVMITVFETRERTELVSEVQQSGRFVFDRIAASVINASSFSIPSPENIELTMPDGSVVMFLLDNGTIYTRTGTGQPQPLTSSLVTVESLVFRNVTDTSVSIELTVSDANEDSMTLRTTHTLRLQ